VKLAAPVYSLVGIPQLPSTVGVAASGNAWIVCVPAPSKGTSPGLAPRVPRTPAGAVESATPAQSAVIATRSVALKVVDGIAARTLPGVSGKGAYFTRGSGHDKFGAYTEDAAAYQDVVDRIKRKFETAARELPKPVYSLQDGADIGIVFVGSPDAAVREAVDRLREQGIRADVMRIRSFPFAPEVTEFLDRYPTVFVVEMNRDAQLRSLLAIETGTPRDRMVSVLDYAGQPIAAETLVTALTTHLEGVAR